MMTGITVLPSSRTDECQVAKKEIDEILYYVEKIKEVYQRMSEREQRECERRVMNLVTELVDLGILDIERYKQLKGDREYFLEDTKRMYSFLVEKLRSVRMRKPTMKRVIMSSVK